VKIALIRVISGKVLPLFLRLFLVLFVVLLSTEY